VEVTVGKSVENNWQRVRAIFDDARQIPLEDRAAFLRAECGGDEALHREVESLLESLDSADLFLETPAVVEVAENSLSDQRLSRGDMLLHYEILDLLGSGGMGEVYLAQDTRLNRKVAIKILQASFVPDEHASRRLLREARAAANLEHPNICHIYEISESDGHSFIVMQYLVGTTLAEMMSRGRMGIAKALDIATQIVEGLVEAHSQGIVHRDIKPANVIVSDKGQVKILDFGLAKFIEVESGAETSQGLNSSGAIMGTVPFMSPEQLRGKFVDARSDVFSLGALLYEMVSGEPAFKRDNNAETISSILNNEPDWSVIPAELRPILAKCLAKSADDRYDSTAKLLRDLTEARRGDISDETPVASSTGKTQHLTTGSPESQKKKQFHFWQSGGDVSDHRAETDPSSAISRISRPWLVATALSVVAVIAAGAFWMQQRPTPASPALDALSPTPLVSWKTAGADNATDYRISHDGRMVAYSSSQHGGAESIYIKQTSDGADFQVTRNRWSDVSPLWSPNDQKIAFVSIRQDQPGIYLTPTLGGPITPLLITEEPNIALRHWSRDGRSIYYEQAGALYRLDVDKKETARVPSLPDPIGRNTRYYAISPDEKSVVYCDRPDGRPDLWLVPLAGGPPTRLTDDDEEETRPVWHPDNKRVLYNVFRKDFAQINYVSVDEPGVPAQITRGVGHYFLINVSDEGDRIYYSTVQWSSDVSSVDVETGREIELAAQPEYELWPDVSPDGNAIIYHLNSNAIPMRKISKSQLVIRPLSEQRQQQLSMTGFDARWLPDSRNVMLFRASENGTTAFEAWIVDTVTGAERKLPIDSIATPSYSQLPTTRMEASVLDFSPDGQRIVFSDNRRAGNLFSIGIGGGEPTRITKNENPNFTYYSPVFSPEGSAVASVSLERNSDPAKKETWRVHSIVNAVERELLMKTDGQIRMLGWTSAGEILVAMTKGVMRPEPNQVEIVALAPDGTTRNLYSLENVYPATLTLSGDKRIIAFTRRDGELDDIWIAPVRSGSAPRKVTNNAVTRQFLTNLTLSPDARTIFFDKQEAVRGISMFENFN
jgi:serine/threonine protein kinase